MTVSAEYVAEHLDVVLEALSNGVAVEIDRPGEATLRLTASAVSVPRETMPRVMGAGKGEMRVPSDEEWDRMHTEWLKSFDDKFGS